MKCIVSNDARAAQEMCVRVCMREGGHNSGLTHIQDDRLSHTPKILLHVQVKYFYTLY